MAQHTVQSVCWRAVCGYLLVAVCAVASACNAEATVQTMPVGNPHTAFYAIDIGHHIADIAWFYAIFVLIAASHLAVVAIAVAAAASVPWVIAYTIWRTHHATRKARNRTVFTHQAWQADDERGKDDDDPQQGPPDIVI